MEALRESLTAGVLKQIEQELGRETMLRLLWPHLVGAQLAANTELKAIRGATLVIGVPDRTWLSSLGSLKTMILDAVNRLGSETYDAVELIEQPRLAALRQGIKPAPGSRRQAPVAAADVRFDASAIADESLRKIFAESARKYLAMQPARRGRKK